MSKTQVAIIGSGNIGADPVTRSIEIGAAPYLGCGGPGEPRAFYPLTVLVDVTPDMPVWSEEALARRADLGRG